MDEPHAYGEDLTAALARMLVAGEETPTLLSRCLLRLNTARPMSSSCWSTRAGSGSNRNLRRSRPYPRIGAQRRSGNWSSHRVQPCFPAAVNTLRLSGSRRCSAQPRSWPSYQSRRSGAAGSSNPRRARASSAHWNTTGRRKSLTVEARGSTEGQRQWVALASRLPGCVAISLFEHLGLCAPVRRSVDQSSLISPPSTPAASVQPGAGGSISAPRVPCAPDALLATPESVNENEPVVCQLFTVADS